MQGFRQVAPTELSENVIKLISKDWMLVTAGSPDHYNTMTASWGAVGFMWNKPVAFCYVRPQRYTYEFMEQNDTYTLTFFPDGYREALNICGSKSGRDIDKARETGLIPIEVDGNVTFAQAKLVLVCKKLYHDDMKQTAFDDRDIIAHDYPNADYHRIYIGEIVAAYVK